jgi:hypothetical protein
MVRYKRLGISMLGSRETGRAILWLCGLAFAFLPVFVSGQALPQHGIVRIPGWDVLTSGTAPGMVAQLDSTLIVQGSGWNEETFERGWFFHAFDGASRTLRADTARVRSQSEPPLGGAMVVPGGLLTLRSMVYDSYDPRYVTGGAASIVEFVSADSNGAFRVQPIDSMVIDITESDSARGWLSHGVRESGGWSTDTVRVMLTTGFSNPAKQARTELRSYVPDDSLGYRHAKTLRLDEGIIFEDFPLAMWTLGDSLGRVELYGQPFEPERAVVRYWNRHTGRYLGLHELKETPWRPDAMVSTRNGLGYMFATTIIELPDERLLAQVEVEAFNLRTGELVWNDIYQPAAGWFLATQVPISRVDSSGRVLVTSFPEGLLRGPDQPDQIHRVVLKAVNARTGDSLWTTRMRQDSGATNVWGTSPSDIAIRPDGKGYVVASWTVDVELDPDRPELGYSYTTLYFLDSIGCLTPGCRETTSTEAPRYAYEISLAPNPIPAGGSLRVTLPSELREVHYAITNAQGQQVHFGESLVAGGQFEVLSPDVPAGIYYLTVWPEGSGNAVVTKAFVVE